ncbi:hypothetical protein AAG570_001714 [Ranatra chinensis]|uniref:Uncharacterized protein n=1 Tax=Ranatra chinensis TaxID=642074 RepID=A0ABD0YXL9_9HEMI
MISRRENLLVRPWQERRYIYHRKKVLSALPAIDVSPPPVRCHVACKMKKLQKEAERCAQIVEDNFTLLQHLRTISNTSRVDNTWLQVPPNFLHRVGIYHPKVGKRRVKDATDITKMTEPKTRKEKCLGCNPHRIIKKTIPEVRVPWDLPKPRLSRKSSSEIREIQVSLLTTEIRTCIRKRVLTLVCRLLL